MTRKPPNPATVLRHVGPGATGEQLADAARVGEQLAGVGHGYEDRSKSEEPADTSDSTKG